MTDIELDDHHRIHADMADKHACRAEVAHMQDPWNAWWLMTTPTQHHPPEGPAWFRASTEQVPSFTDGIALNKTGAHC